MLGTRRVRRGPEPETFAFVDKCRRCCGPRPFFVFESRPLSPVVGRRWGRTSMGRLECALNGAEADAFLLEANPRADTVVAEIVVELALVSGESVEIATMG